MISNVRAVLKVAVNVAKTHRHVVDSVVLSSIALIVSITSIKLYYWSTQIYALRFNSILKSERGVGESGAGKSTLLDIMLMSFANIP